MEVLKNFVRFRFFSHDECSLTSVLMSTEKQPVVNIKSKKKTNGLLRNLEKRCFKYNFERSLLDFEYSKAS